MYMDKEGALGKIIIMNNLKGGAPFKFSRDSLSLPLLSIKKMDRIDCEKGILFESLGLGGRRENHNWMDRAVSLWMR